MWLFRMLVSVSLKPKYLYIVNYFIFKLRPLAYIWDNIFKLVASDELN